jgi:hypothetical protein
MKKILVIIVSLLFQQSIALAKGVCATGERFEFQVVCNTPSLTNSEDSEEKLYLFEWSSDPSTATAVCKTIGLGSAIPGSETPFFEVETEADLKLAQHYAGVLVLNADESILSVKEIKKGTKVFNRVICANAHSWGFSPGRGTIFK